MSVTSALGVARLSVSRFAAAQTGSHYWGQILVASRTAADFSDKSLAVGGDFAQPGK